MPDRTVHRVLDTARFAPNGGNRQAWRVIVVKDPALRRAMRDVYLPGWYQYLAQSAAGLTPWAVVTDRELERQAKFLGEVQSAGIVESEDVRAGKADSAGDAIAIFTKAVERRIGMYCQIHFGAGNEIVEIASGQIVTAQGIDEGGQNLGCAG